MNQPPSIKPSPPATAKAMPLLVRAVNVFAVPGDVFENVKASPNAPSAWLGPILIACTVGVAAVIILFSKPAILEEMNAMRAKTLQQQVDKGAVTQEQAEAAAAMLEKFSAPTFMKVSGSVGVVVASFARVFWWAFGLWILALLFIRVRIPYLKALEVAGLASLIGTLGMLVTLLMRLNFGRTSATPSLAFMVPDFDPGNKMHLVMGALNLIQVWMVLVMGLGLARLTGVPFMRASLLVIAFYFLQTSALVLMGAGMAMI